MRQVAWTLAALLLLVLLNVQPVAATCSVAEDPVQVDVCPDENGNATPDRVSVGTPVGSAKVGEPSCGSCGQPTTVVVDLHVAGQDADASLQCYTVMGQANVRCVDGEARAGSETAGAYVRTTTGPGPNTWVCQQVHLWFVTQVHCQRVPHPVQLPL